MNATTLVEDIIEQIITGNLAPGDGLGDSADLAQEYGTDEATIDAAMLTLADMFYVERDDDGQHYVSDDPGTNPTYLAAARS